jgi:hypothetical protein
LLYSVWICEAPHNFFLLFKCTKLILLSTYSLI